MGLPITSAVTGQTITGIITSPSFTCSVDVPPNAYTLRYLVTGNSVNAGSVHTISLPWTIQIKRPGVFKTIRDLVYSTAGRLVRVPKNNYSMVIKRMVPITNDGNGNSDYGEMEVNIHVVLPAGAETHGQLPMSEALSLASGLLSTKIADFRTMMLTGSMS